MRPSTTHWSRPAPAVDAAFIAAAVAWADDAELALLGHVWAGYDRIVAERPAINTRDLERSITQHFEPMIRDVMSGDEPYYIQHGSYERETMREPPAQPPAYDLAFVFRADPRVMWPLEAKVLASPSALADYLKDLQEEYLTCRYAPFSPSGAMLGYLLQGSGEDALRNISGRLGMPLRRLETLQGRPCALSTHDRVVPKGKPYPSRFTCHHIILSFPKLRRHKTRPAGVAASAAIRVRRKRRATSRKMGNKSTSSA